MGKARPLSKPHFPRENSASAFTRFSTLPASARQSHRKHGCHELKTARQHRAHTWGARGSGWGWGEFTTRDRHLGPSLRLPKRLVSTPSPRTCSVPESHSGASEVIQHYWKWLCARLRPCPQGTHSLGEQTHNQPNALCKCRGRRADPRPERQSLLKLLGRPGVDQNSPGSPGGPLRSADRGLRIQMGTAQSGGGTSQTVLGMVRGRRGQDGERTCVAHMGLR